MDSDCHLDGSESSPGKRRRPRPPPAPIFRPDSMQYDAAARGLRRPVHPCRANCAPHANTGVSPSPDDDDDRFRRCQQSHAFTPIDVAVGFQQIPVKSTGTCMEKPVLPRPRESKRPDQHAIPRPRPPDHAGASMSKCSASASGQPTWRRTWQSSGAMTRPRPCPGAQRARGALCRPPNSNPRLPLFRRAYWPLESWKMPPARAVPKTQTQPPAGAAGSNPGPRRGTRIKLCPPWPNPAHGAWSRLAQLHLQTPPNLMPFSQPTHANPSAASSSQKRMAVLSWRKRATAGAALRLQTRPVAVGSWRR